MSDPEPTADINSPEALEKRRLAQEAKDERQVWIFLAWFLFGIHIIAFVLIYAIHHAP